MILRRLGNKQRIAPKILQFFPQHKIYIEPFFGAGGMFFHKPKAKYNIVNDLDSDVFNLFMVVSKQKEELERRFKIMPIHTDLLAYWKEHDEIEPVQKAIRFLFITNFTFMGGGASLNLGHRPCSKLKDNEFTSYLNKTFEMIKDVQFGNMDFRKFISSIQIRSIPDEHFIYSDPPYLETEKYITEWTENDVNDCFDKTFNSGIKAAMSEFDHPFIIEQAKQRNLNIIYIGERQNMKNRKTEILVTNYQKAPTLF